MNSQDATIAAAVIASLPGWAAFAWAAGANRRAIERQTRAMSLQTTELKDHITATASAAPPTSATPEP